MCMCVGVGWGGVWGVWGVWVCVCVGGGGVCGGVSADSSLVDVYRDIHGWQLV